MVKEQPGNNQHRRATDTRNGARRSFILSVLNWSQPILLSLILFATTWAARAAKSTAVAVAESGARQDSTLDVIRAVVDTTKRDVNSAKSKVDSVLGVERDYNAKLQAQLRAKGIEPEPRQPKQGPS